MDNNQYTGPLSTDEIKQRIANMIERRNDQNLFDMDALLADNLAQSDDPVKRDVVEKFKRAQNANPFYTSDLPLSQQRAINEVFSHYNLPEDYTQQAVEEGFGRRRIDRNLDYTALTDDHDLEHHRAEAQSSAAQIVNGVIKFVPQAGTVIADAIAGSIAGAFELGKYTGEAIAGAEHGFTLSGAMDAAVQNPISEKIVQSMDIFERIFPNYYTEEERNNPWWQHINANMIGDHFIKNLGFTAGAVASGLILGRGSSQLQSGRIFNRLFKGAVAAGSGDAAATSLAKKIATGTVSGAALERNAGDIAKRIFYSGTANALAGSIGAAIGEARIEALNAAREFMQTHNDDAYSLYNDYISNLDNELFSEHPDWYGVEQYVDENGEPNERLVMINPEGQAVKDRLLKDAYNKYTDRRNKLDQEAANVANAVFGLNVPLLAFDNMIMFGKVFSGGYKTARKMMSPVKNVGGEFVARGTKAGAIAKGVYRPLSEGFEEMNQRVISENAKDVYGKNLAAYYNDSLDTEQIRGISDFLANMLSTTGEVYSDPNAWEEFVIGSLTGAISSFVGQHTIKDDLNELKDRADLANTLNEYMSSGKVKDALQSYIVHAKNAQTMEDAAAVKDKFAYHTAEDKDLVNVVMKYARAGALDELREFAKHYVDISDAEVGEIRDILSTDTDSGILKDTSNSDVRKFVAKRANKLLSTIDSYDKIYDYISTRINVNDNNEDAVSEMLFTGSMVDMFEKRYSDMWRGEDGKSGIRERIRNIANAFSDAGKTDSRISNILSALNNDISTIDNNLSSMQIEHPVGIILDAEMLKTISKHLNVFTTELKRAGVPFDEDIESDFDDFKKVFLARNNYYAKLNHPEMSQELFSDFNKDKKTAEQTKKEINDKKVAEQAEYVPDPSSVRDINDYLNGEMSDDEKKNAEKIMMGKSDNPAVKEYSEMKKAVATLEKDIDNNDNRTEREKYHAKALLQWMLRNSEGLTSFYDYKLPESINEFNEDEYTPFMYEHDPHYARMVDTVDKLDPDDPQTAFMRYEQIYKTAAELVNKAISRAKKANLVAGVSDQYGRKVGEASPQIKVEKPEQPKIDTKAKEPEPVNPTTPDPQERRLATVPEETPKPEEKPESAPEEKPAKEAKAKKSKEPTEDDLKLIQSQYDAIDEESKARLGEMISAERHQSKGVVQLVAHYPINGTQQQMWMVITSYPDDKRKVMFVLHSDKFQKENYVSAKAVFDDLDRMEYERTGFKVNDDEQVLYTQGEVIDEIDKGYRPAQNDDIAERSKLRKAKIIKKDGTTKTADGFELKYESAIPQVDVSQMSIVLSEEKRKEDNAYLNIDLRDFYLFGNNQNYEKIFTFLNEQGAFDYVAKGNLYPGDEISFKILPTNVLPEYDGYPQIILTKGVHIIGVLRRNDKTYDGRTIYGLKELHQSILHDYNQWTKTNDPATKEFSYKKKSHVWRVKKGVVWYNDDPTDISQIVNYNEKAPVIFMLGDGTPTLVRGTKMPKFNYDKLRNGAFYYLVENSDHTFYPVRLRLARFSNMDTPGDTDSHTYKGMYDELIKIFTDESIRDTSTESKKKASQDYILQCFNEASKYAYIRNVMGSFGIEKGVLTFGLFTKREDAVKSMMNVPEDAKTDGEGYVRFPSLDLNDQDGKAKTPEQLTTELLEIIKELVQPQIQINMRESKRVAANDLANGIKNGYVRANVNDFQVRGSSFYFDPYDPETGEFTPLFKEDVESRKTPADQRREDYNKEQDKRKQELAEQREKHSAPLRAILRAKRNNVKELSDDDFNNGNIIDESRKAQINSIIDNLGNTKSLVEAINLSQQLQNIVYEIRYTSPRINKILKDITNQAKARGYKIVNLYAEDYDKIPNVTYQSSKVAYPGDVGIIDKVIEPRIINKDGKVLSQGVVHVLKGDGTALRLNQIDNIDFNEDTHTYVRTTDGKVLEGVTTLMENQGVSADYSEVGDGDPIAKERILRNAAARGSAIHRAIEEYDNGITRAEDGTYIGSDYAVYDYVDPETNETVRKSVPIRSIIANYASLGMPVLASEYLITDGNNFASMIDKVLSVKDDQVDLVDIKTTSTVHEKALQYQLSIYANLFEKMNPSKSVRKLMAIMVDRKTGKVSMIDVKRLPNEEVERVMNAEAKRLADERGEVVATETETAINPNTSTVIPAPEPDDLDGDVGSDDWDVDEDAEGYVARETYSLSPEEETIADFWMHQIMQNSNLKVHIVSDAEMRRLSNDIYGLSDNIFGLNKNGEVYINQEKIDPSTSVHEYAHSWWNAIRIKEPNLYQQGLSLMRENTKLWDEVENSENYGQRWRGMNDHDDRVASEVFARLTGSRSAELFRQLEGDGKTDLLSRIKNWIHRVCEFIKDTFTNWSREDASKVTDEQLMNMAIRDLVMNVRFDADTKVGDDTSIAAGDYFSANSTFSGSSILPRTTVSSKLVDASKMAWTTASLNMDRSRADQIHKAIFNAASKDMASYSKLSDDLNSIKSSEASKQTLHGAFGRIMGLILDDSEMRNVLSEAQGVYNASSIPTLKNMLAQDFFEWQTSRMYKTDALEAHIESSRGRNAIQNLFVRMNTVIENSGTMQANMMSAYSSLNSYRRADNSQVSDTEETATFADTAFANKILSYDNPHLADIVAAKHDGNIAVLRYAIPNGTVLMQRDDTFADEAIKEAVKALRQMYRSGIAIDTRSGANSIYYSEDEGFIFTNVAPAESISLKDVIDGFYNAIGETSLNFEYLDSETKQYLSEAGFTEESYDRLSQAEKDQLIHCYGV